MLVQPALKGACAADHSISPLALCSPPSRVPLPPHPKPDPFCDSWSCLQQAETPSSCLPAALPNTMALPLLSITHVCLLATPEKNNVFYLFKITTFPTEISKYWGSFESVSEERKEDVSLLIIRLLKVLRYAVQYIWLYAMHTVYKRTWAYPTTWSSILGIRMLWHVHLLKNILSNQATILQIRSMCIYCAHNKTSFPSLSCALPSHYLWTENFQSQ